jgi:hypothetical protein
MKLNLITVAIILLGSLLFAYCEDVVVEDHTGDAAVVLVSNNSTEPTDEELESQFFAWLREKGVQVNGVDMRKFDRMGRGLVANKSLEAGTEIFRVPGSMLLSMDSSLNHPEIGEILVNYEALHQSRAALVIVLLYERNKGNSSQYWPYLRLLPNEYNTPVFWSEEDKEELTGSFILDRMAADLEGFESEYNEVFVDGLFVDYPDIFTPEKYSFDDYVWGWTTVFTRSVGLTIPGEGFKAYLAPGIDFMNHKAAAKTNLVLDEATNELVFTVEEDLDIGDQIFRDYSPGIPNLELIRIWGFIDEKNQREVAAINANLNDEDPDLDTKLKWLAARKVIKGQSMYPYTDYFVYSEGVPDRIMALLRAKFYTMKSSERKNIATLPNPLQLIEDDNERAAFLELNSILSTHLKRFGTTLEEDIQLLEKSGDLTDRQWYALLARTEEKLAITNALESFKAKRVSFEDNNQDAAVQHQLGKRDFKKQTINKKRRKPSSKRSFE